MVRVRTLILLLLMTSAMKLNSTKEGLRVYGGTDDVTSKYPFVVCIKSDAFIRTGSGTLITPTWVLTAAHCCSNYVKYIQWGDIKLPQNQTESKSEVLKMFPHPRYVPNTMACNDIGLFLVRQVIMNAYGKLSALDYTTLSGHRVEFAGFGMTYLPLKKTRGRAIKAWLDENVRPLQTGEAVVTSCAWSDVFFVIGCICVSPKCSKTQYSLNGDSGGPLFFESKIIAVVQSGLMDYKNTDSFYTPVSPHLNWIHNVITSKKI